MSKNVNFWKSKKKHFITEKEFSLRMKNKLQPLTLNERNKRTKHESKNIINAWNSRKRFSVKSSLVEKRRIYLSAFLLFGELVELGIVKLKYWQNNFFFTVLWKVVKNSRRKHGEIRDHFHGSSSHTTRWWVPKNQRIFLYLLKIYTINIINFMIHLYSLLAYNWNFNE